MKENVSSYATVALEFHLCRVDREMLTAKGFILPASVSFLGDTVRRAADTCSLLCDTAVLQSSGSGL